MKENNNSNFTWRARIIFKVFFSIVLEFVFDRFQRIFRGIESMDRLRPELYRRQAVRLRETAIMLGGVWIKLGQFFSTRVDLLPREYTEELSKLQNEVTFEDASGIIQVIEQEFGKPINDIFTSFNRQALAAASLGQVHLARIPTGELVAVKVLRPGIEKVVESDLKTLQRIIILLELLTDWGRRFDISALYREFSNTLVSELDYIQEGKNCERFQNNFAAENRVIIPQVYWDYTTRRVLTLEYLQGYKITDVQQWETIIAPSSLVALLVETYIQQILEQGFFHADPHPGNLLVLPDGRLGLIDFGMVGQVTALDKDGLRKLILAMATKNSPGMVKAFLELGFLRPETDAVVVRRALDQILERVYDMPLGRFTNEQWIEIMHQFEEVVRAEPFQIPSTFIFLGRTLGTLFGLCVELQPDTQFISLLEPHLKRLALTDDSGEIWEQYRKKAVAFLGTLGELPELMQRTLSLAEQGNLHIKIDSYIIARILRSQERAIRFLGRSIVFAAFLITAVIMYINEKTFESHVYLGVAGIVGLFLIFGWSDRNRSSGPGL